MPALPIPASDLLVPAPSPAGEHQVGVARCAHPPVAVPKPAPDDAQRGPTGSKPAGRATQRSATAAPEPRPGPGAIHPDAGDARERAERALESQRRTFPVAPNVPAEVAAGAIECARLLQLEFTLRASGGAPIDEAAIRAALRATGLTKAVVAPGPRFATSTGRACIIGTVTAGRPAMTIAALPPAGTCRL
ncbi:MAG TPA: hypothetical protein VFH03_20155 [Actinoplanes sp.]|nr:hypothetical protein [Actinoplanes sp.]